MMYGWAICERAMMYGWAICERAMMRGRPICRCMACCCAALLRGMFAMVHEWCRTVAWMWRGVFAMVHERPICERAMMYGWAICERAMMRGRTICRCAVCCCAALHSGCREYGMPRGRCRVRSMYVMAHEYGRGLFAMVHEWCRTVAWMWRGVFAMVHERPICERAMMYGWAICERAMMRGRPICERAMMRGRPICERAMMRGRTICRCAVCCCAALHSGCREYGMPRGRCRIQNDWCTDDRFVGVWRVVSFGLWV